MRFAIWGGRGRSIPAIGVRASGERRHASTTTSTGLSSVGRWRVQQEGAVARATGESSTTSASGAYASTTTTSGLGSTGRAARVTGGSGRRETGRAVAVRGGVSARRPDGTNARALSLTKQKSVDII
jgi:hypothetical protein